MIFPQSILNYRMNTDERKLCVLRRERPTSSWAFGNADYLEPGSPEDDPPELVELSNKTLSAYNRNVQSDNFTGRLVIEFVEKVMLYSQF